MWDICKYVCIFLYVLEEKVWIEIELLSLLKVLVKKCVMDINICVYLFKLCICGFKIVFVLFCIILNSLFKIKLNMFMNKLYLIIFELSICNLIIEC